MKLIRFGALNKHSIDGNQAEVKASFFTFLKNSLKNGLFQLVAHAGHL